MAFQLPDPSTPFGERIARRLRNERLMWLTTVDANGMPQPTPVWFLWDEATSTILIYSRSDAKRLEQLLILPRTSCPLTLKNIAISSPGVMTRLRNLRRSIPLPCA